MLIELTVRDLVLVEDATLQPDAGLTVITGETGAGKSILLEALRLVLGGRAGADMLRVGAERTQLTALFEVPNAGAAAGWLRENEFVDPDAPGQCQLRRTIGADGRSRSWINDAAVTLARLRELAPLLVNLHGQSEAHALLASDAQLALLDAWGVDATVLARVASDHAALTTARAELHALEAAAARRRERTDLLRYQLQELDELDPGTDEYPELDARQRQLAAAESSRLTVAGALADLDGDDDSAGLTSLLARLIDRTRMLAATWPEAVTVLEQLDTAQIGLEEAREQLRALEDAIEEDPQALAEVDERLQRWTRLARKHGCDPEQLPQLRAELTAEAASLAGDDDRLTRLTRTVDALAAAWADSAATLTAQRQSAATRFATAVRTRGEELAMAELAFEIEFEPRASEHPLGAERIRFLASANADRAPRRLSQGLSGGELSRLSLLCRVVAADRGHAGCLIFDEPDVGIGGSTADTVGRMLSELASGAQVICVTHLPQVAAWGGRHVHVRRRGQPASEAGGASRSELVTLSEADRIEELARMLGGARVSDTARAGARELLQTAAAARA